MVANKESEPLKWVANFLLIVAAALVSFSIEFSSSPYPYIAFFLAHITWMIFARKMCDSALIWLMALFIPLDVYAIYIRL